MAQRNTIGATSLLIAIGGMATTTAAIHAGYLVHPAWRILEAGFEAATVGGVADWFAVTALFREVPIPFIRRHTNILVRKRRQLAEGAVDLVSNQWLTAENIEGHLKKLAIVDGLLKLLDAPEHRKLALSVLRELLLRIAQDLDQQAFVTLLEKAIRRELEAQDLGKIVGRVLRRLCDEGGLEEILYVGGAGVLRTLKQPETLDEIEAMLRQRLPEAVRERHPFAGSAVLRGLELTGIVDYPKLAGWVARELGQQVAAVAATPDNPLRVKLEDALKKTADGLISGDPEVGQAVRQLLSQLLSNTDLSTGIAAMLKRLKATAIEDLSGEDSAIGHLLEDQFAHLTDELKSNAELRNQLNTWLTATVSSLIRNHHSAIADMTRAALDPARLPDEALVEQIESKVGDDLQYIRLNGAIVGGLVGMLIAAIRMLVEA